MILPFELVRGLRRVRSVVKKALLYAVKKFRFPRGGRANREKRHIEMACLLGLLAMK